MPPAEPRVTQVRFHRAKPFDVLGGLIGYAAVEFEGGLVVRGLAVRHTRSGRTVVSFPTRDGRPVVHPVDAETHAEIERQVVDQLRQQGRLRSEEASSGQ